MPIQKKNEFKVLSIEEIANLSDYKRRRYDVELEALQKKKEIKNNFSKYLNESCEKYSV